MQHYTLWTLPLARPPSLTLFSMREVTHHTPDAVARLPPQWRPPLRALLASVPQLSDEQTVLMLWGLAAQQHVLLSGRPGRAPPTPPAAAVSGPASVSAADVGEGRVVDVGEGLGVDLGEGLGVETGATLLQAYAWGGGVPALAQAHGVRRAEALLSRLLVRMAAVPPYALGRRAAFAAAEALAWLLVGPCAEMAGSAVAELPRGLVHVLTRAWRGGKGGGARAVGDADGGDGARGGEGGEGGGGGGGGGDRARGGGRGDGSGGGRAFPSVRAHRPPGRRCRAAAAHGGVRPLSRRVLSRRALTRRAALRAAAAARRRVAPSPGATAHLAPHLVWRGAAAQLSQVLRSLGYDPTPPAATHPELPLLAAPGVGRVPPPSAFPNPPHTHDACSAAPPPSQSLLQRGTPSLAASPASGHLPPAPLARVAAGAHGGRHALTLRGTRLALLLSDSDDFSANRAPSGRGEPLGGLFTTLQLMEVWARGTRCTCVDVCGRVAALCAYLVWVLAGEGRGVDVSENPGVTVTATV
eukprot:221960-Chlamydomonas_euryale.AAC.1